LRDYEVVIVVAPTGGEDGFTSTVERVGEFIKNEGGEVTKVDPWGMRKLAYPINRHMEGFYAVTEFKIEPTSVRAIEDNIGRAEEILRHLVVRQDEIREIPEKAEKAETVEQTEPEKVEPAAEVERTEATAEVAQTESAEPTDQAEPAAEVEQAEEVEQKESGDVGA
jgi:small subunit ribosomal protein S6